MKIKAKLKFILLTLLNCVGDLIYFWDHGKEIYSLVGKSSCLVSVTGICGDGQFANMNRNVKVANSKERVGIQTDGSGRNDNQRHRKKAVWPRTMNIRHGHQNIEGKEGDSKRVGRRE